MRLLFQKEYQGKDLDYVKYDIEKRLEHYEMTCKKHGLEFWTSTVSSLLDPKSVGGLAFLSLIGLVGGGPTVLSGIAAGACVLELGKLVVKIFEKRLDISQNEARFELAYVIDARKSIQARVPNELDDFFGDSWRIPFWSERGVGYSATSDDRRWLQRSARSTALARVGIPTAIAAMLPARAFPASLLMRQGRIMTRYEQLQRMAYAPATGIRQSATPHAVALRKRTRVQEAELHFFFRETPCRP